MTSSALISPYQRAGRSVGVIHFGLGAFHRGHQAVYFDDALRKDLGEWGIYGISPRSSQVTDLLRQQNFIYTVNARQDSSQRPQIISSIFDGALFDLENPEMLAAAISPQLKIITITVTEKAYVSGVDGNSMPNRVIDLLSLRFESGLSAPTLISCDNLPSNGAFLQRVIRESAAARNLEPSFQEWLRDIATPDSMVDRIVPAMTPEEIEQFAGDFGYRDNSLISTEPYRQWVIAPHKLSYDLSQFNVQISSEIAQYEQLKLRLFNGAHSATAYFSQLSHIEYVYQAMQLPRWEAFITRLQQQIGKSCTAPTGMDIDHYSESARVRIANSALLHRSAQIAMDGSAKLPQRLFRAFNQLARENLPRELVAFAIALWISYLRSNPAVVDPLADELVKRANGKNPVTGVMQTPGLREPIVESEWNLVESFVRKLEIQKPLEIAKEL
jgi:fructuronate reductase